MAAENTAIVEFYVSTPGDRDTTSAVLGPCYNLQDAILWGQKAADRLECVLEVWGVLHSDRAIRILQPKEK